MTSEPILLTEDHGPIRVLTLNAPAKLNALSDAMLAALGEALDALERDAGRIRVVVLRGAGKVFCAGHDLAEMRAGRNAEDGGKAYLSELFKTCSAVMLRLQKLPQPVIAQVHGIATAAGCQLVATCDLAVTARSTRFGVNGVNVGLFCSTPMVALTRNVPRKQAFEMLMTGEFASAERAREMGLVNRVVEDEDLEAETMKLAETIAGKLGRAVRIGKRAFYDQIHMPVEEAYAHTGQVMVINMIDDDTAEGIAAFLEKRPPNWTQ